MVGRVVALVALVAVVIAAVLVIAKGGGDDYEVTGEFTNASQLVRGNEVTIGGVAAGTVKSIELGDNGNALVIGNRRPACQSCGFQMMANSFSSSEPADLPRLA